MNIGTLLTKSAQTCPNQLAIVYGDHQWTYAQFNARTNQLANALRNLGVAQGHHVAVLMYNYPQMLEAMFACFKMGCTAVPINFRLHSNEFSFIIEHSKAETVITSPEFTEPLRLLHDRLPRVRHTITTSGADRECLDYESVLRDGHEEFKDAEVNPDDVAWLFYTSGTTGRPKGAMLTHRNLMAMSQDFYISICPGFGRNEVVMHAAPLSHGSGLYAIPNVGKAAMHVIPAARSFDPQMILQTVEQYHVTNMFIAPTMVKLLIDSPAIDQYDHSSLKAMIYGGGPMLVEDLTNAIEKFGPCLVQLYGQGESPMTISYLPHLDHVLNGTEKQMKHLASAGITHTDLEIAIFDGEDRPLPFGEIGEIVTRSDVVMKGYWRDSDATAKTLRNGWLHTGDLCSMDERGYFYVRGRLKDMIIRGGENIYPRELEDILFKHPTVAEVAVVGVPDQRWGEQVAAFVRTTDGGTTTASALHDFMREHLAPHKTPKIWIAVDAFPLTPSGKIQKFRLIEMYETGQLKQNMTAESNV